MLGPVISQHCKHACKFLMLLWVQMLMLFCPIPSICVSVHEDAIFACSKNIAVSQCHDRLAASAHAVLFRNSQTCALTRRPQVWTGGQVPEHT